MGRAQGGQNETRTRPSSIWSGGTVTAPAHMYLKVVAETSDGRVAHDAMAPALSHALQAMYGAVGGAVLRYEWMDVDVRPGVAVLRTSVAHYQRIWAALTMLPALDERPVRFTVVSATPFPVALRDAGEGLAEWERL